MKTFKKFFKQKKKIKKMVAPSNNEFRDATNYINQPPYGAEGRRLTPNG